MNADRAPQLKAIVRRFDSAATLQPSYETIWRSERRKGNEQKTNQLGIHSLCVFLSTLVVAQQNEETNSGKLKPGSYRAIATQITEYLEVKETREVEIKIKIDSVDNDGNVSGEFIHSTLGKGGKGRKQGLTGKMGAKELILEGSLISRFGDTWGITLNVTVEPTGLRKGRYRIESRNPGENVTLKGAFDIAKFEDDN